MIAVKYISDILLEDFTVLTKITLTILPERLLHKLKLSYWLEDEELPTFAGLGSRKEDMVFLPTVVLWSQTACFLLNTNIVSRRKCCILVLAVSGSCLKVKSFEQNFPPFLSSNVLLTQFDFVRHLMTSIIITLLFGFWMTNVFISSLMRFLFYEDSSWKSDIKSF